jgi:hypothetical protein
MSKQLPDKISITWHFTDIQEVDDSLTNDQARQILQALARTHDCNQGISWTVIEAVIDTFRTSEAIN